MPLLTSSCIDALNKAVLLTDYLGRSEKYPKESPCPFCGSPHHVITDPKTNIGTCQRCHTGEGGEQKGFNLIQAVEQKEALSFLEACKFISDRYNIPLEYEGRSGPENPVTDSSSLTQKEDPPEVINLENTPGKFKEYIKTSAGNIDAGGREYLNNRGITNEIIDKYKIGYTEKHVFYDKKARYYTPAIVFPYNTQDSYYSLRSTTKKCFYKPPEKDAGNEPLYNPAALYTGRPCFVCESIIDALSVITAGGEAVATGGRGYNKIKLQIEKSGRPDAPLILFYDNDVLNDKGHRPGQESQRELAKELKKNGIPYTEIIINYPKYQGKKKDANDLLLTNPAQFAEDIKKNEEAAKDSTGIKSFLLKTKTEAYKPIKTGLPKIDKLLGGGFISQTLVLLGGPPGSGKSILASMIIESLAKGGRECIYFNFEMSREQLIARSLSRRVYQNPRNNKAIITPTDILQGYKLTELDNELVEAAAADYQKEIGTRLQYNPEGMDPDVDKLKDLLEEAGERAEREGKPGPIICIDYVHLLTAPGEDAAAVIKKATTILKDYAVKYDTIVLALEAQNRTANNKDTAILSGGRDSSALEYSGDTILSIIHAKDTEENERNICVTKSRFSEINMKGYTMTLKGHVALFEDPEEALEDWKTAHKTVFD